MYRKRLLKSEYESEEYKVEFDRIINRINTQCCKWDSEEPYRTGQVLPMWVADMDLPVPDEVSEAIRKRAEHPVFGYPYDDGGMAESLQGLAKKKGTAGM